jgi:serine/threonine protein phosphatase 1
MGRTFCIGDIHGAHLALQQVLERSGFDKENDQLITLGDIADGWPYVAECVDIILTIKNRIDILGNHDEWFRHWLMGGTHPVNWMQGGIGTVKSYLRASDNEHLLYESKYMGIQSGLNQGDISVDHWKFFMHQILYYQDTVRNYFFCHAGWNRESLVAKVRQICPEEFYWDRELWKKAMCCADGSKLKTADNFDTIFIGHTTTTAWKTDQPLYKGGIWNLDTGAGWSGKLTIMDIDTKEYFQSDSVEGLYPDDVGRRKR